jgi:hypothetical protein
MHAHDILLRDANQIFLGHQHDSCRPMAIIPFSFKGRALPRGLGELPLTEVSGMFDHAPLDRARYILRALPQIVEVRQRLPQIALNDWPTPARF